MKKTTLGPIPDAAVATPTRVVMTSMNTGQANPEVHEVSAGHYRVDVAFTMHGSWDVVLRFPNGGGVGFGYAAGG